jgi:hypothetical protein
VHGCGAMILWWIGGVVRSIRVFSGGGVVVMGIVGVTTLHPQGLEIPELPPPPEAMSPSSEDSSRMVCRYGNPLCTIPMNMAPESFPSGERLRSPKRSVMNSRMPKQIVSPGVSPTLVRLLPLAMEVSFGE